MGVENEKERVSAEVIRSGPESTVAPVLPTVNPAVERKEVPASTFHPAVYVITWISLSSATILFNKQILDKWGFPVVLTTWHLLFATLMTQLLARTTKLLDGRKTVKMTGRIYLRAIVPIGAFFSLSLICGNMTYLYLSVAFIQMLKATTPVAVLIVGSLLGVDSADKKKFLNVSVIVIGVIIASFGEIKFRLIGFLFQLGGVAFEATRLVLVQKLLSSAEYKMDPLVSLYYFAPVCAVMNFCVAAVVELPVISMAEVYKVGLLTFLANAAVAFALNVSVVFLIGKTSSLIMTLCGVLKDILLVFASIMIWGTPVTALQYFGYGIALCGLVYFKLGADTLKAQFSEANRQWAEYGAKRPAMRKVIVFGVILLVIIALLGGIAPSAGYNKEYLQSLVGQNSAGDKST